MRRTDTLIVGGGPAGAAAAIVLARAGAAPRVLERSTTPQDALCGGFLSWATLARLETLGVDAFALGGHPITRVRLIAGRRMREAPLQQRSAGLSRLALDAALLANAGEAGATIERGVKVRSWDDGALQIDGGEMLRPANLILATGKHDLRGLPRPHSADDSIGLRFRFVPSPALAATLDGRIELHLFDHGYAGLLLQEDGSANLCMALRRQRLSDAEGRPERLLAQLATEAPLLGERLAGSDVGASQAIAGVPYGWQARTGLEGIYRVGDQAAAIASLAGEGVGIALASGMAAADAVLRGESAGAFQQRLAAALARPVRTATRLWSVAERPRLARLALATLPAALLKPLARATRVPLTAAPSRTTFMAMSGTKIPESDWKQKLDPQQYHVLREAGTERAFTGKYWNNHEDGVYRCAGCGEPLFDSATKFESGSGWPSFTEPLGGEAVDEHSDVSHGMRRVEVRCAKCEGHLGHVFPDGPGENGLRYCINSASLDFEPKKDA